MNINYYIIIGILILITLKIIFKKNVKEDFSLRYIKDGKDGTNATDNYINSCMTDAQNLTSTDDRNIGKALRLRLEQRGGKALASMSDAEKNSAMEYLLGGSDGDSDYRSQIGRKISNYSDANAYPNRFAVYLDERSKIGLNGTIDYNDTEKQQILDQMAIPIELPNVKCKDGSSLESNPDCELELDEPTTIKLFYKDKPFNIVGKATGYENYCDNVVKCHCTDEELEDSCKVDFCTYRIRYVEPEPESS